MKWSSIGLPLFVLAGSLGQGGGLVQGARNHRLDRQGTQSLQQFGATLGDLAEFVTQVQLRWSRDGEFAAVWSDDWQSL